MLIDHLQLMIDLRQPTEIKKQVKGILNTLISLPLYSSYMTDCRVEIAVYM